jgi:hypothetical protein
MLVINGVSLEEAHPSNGLSQLDQVEKARGEMRNDEIIERTTQLKTLNHNILMKDPQSRNTPVWQIERQPGTRV